MPGGMESDIDNPLGAARTISTAAMRTPISACMAPTGRIRSASRIEQLIRLFNHDIIDLFARAPVGTPVVVIQTPTRAAELAEAEAQAAPPAAMESPAPPPEPPLPYFDNGYGYWPPYGEGARGLRRAELQAGLLRRAAHAAAFIPRLARS